MRLAKSFVDIDTAEKEPSELTFKRYMPIGSTGGSGKISVSAFEAAIPSKAMLFRGVRFEVSSADDYGVDGIATLDLDGIKTFVATLDQLANVIIDKKRFALSEVEASVENVRLVVFNTEGQGVHAAIEIDGATCHLIEQKALMNLVRLIELAVEHLAAVS